MKIALQRNIGVIVLFSLVLLYTLAVKQLFHLSIYVMTHEPCAAYFHFAYVGKKIIVRRYEIYYKCILIVCQKCIKCYRIK